MENLKIEKKVVYKIDYNEWDKFVNDFFGLVENGMIGNQSWTQYGYEIAADEELGNDSKFEYAPDGKISEYDIEYTLDALLVEKRNPGYSTRVIMDYFVQHGILDNDKTYQIDVSW